MMYEFGYQEERMSNEKRPRWLKLDNAGKIYPAAKRRSWSSLFRMSATLTEPVDQKILAQAQKNVLRRLNTFSMRLKRGFFWYYLESNNGEPEIVKDGSYPCSHLDPKRNRGFNFRVCYYENRIAVEIYHVLTDGTGGITFLKTLVAEYLRLKHGISIPYDDSILDCSALASPKESEDSFLKYARRIAGSRSESDAYHIKGTLEKDKYLHVTCGTIPLNIIMNKAKEKGVTLTTFLVSVLILAINDVQMSEHKANSRLKPVKITVPINLRRFFKSTTLRNFSMFVNPGIDPRLGEYTLDEVLMAVHHFMGMELNEKSLNARFTGNVLSEKNLFIRIMPLFIKNFVMKLIFNYLGDRKSSSTLSNLGRVKLPEEMEQYVERMDWMLGPLSKNPVACTALSYKELLYINMTRTITESKVEKAFFTRLIKLGIPVRIESNQR